MFRFILCLSLLILSGCLTVEKQNSLVLAPPPAAEQGVVSTQPHHITHQRYNFPVSRETFHPFEEGESPLSTETLILGQGAHPVNLTPKECHFKDRFDRKVLLAYEWGRSRLALDVDGMTLGGSTQKAMRFEYKIRLQPERTKRQRCRYNSKWQGLIGSSYNEFFVREEDTVWQELKVMHKDAQYYIERLF